MESNLAKQFKDSLDFLHYYRGKGKVVDKNIDYNEVLAISHLRDTPTIIKFSQVTESMKNEKMHCEEGYVKILPKLYKDSKVRFEVEANWIHPFSVNEFGHGYYDMSTKELHLESDPEDFQRGRFSKPTKVKKLIRDYKLGEKEIEYKIHMQVEGGELYFHLYNKLQLADLQIKN